MSSEYETDLGLKAKLDRLLIFPATSRTWSDVEERARQKGWTPDERRPSAAEDEDRIGARKQESMRKASASKRSTGLRVAVFASVAVVLVAAITVGSLIAAQYFGQPHFVLAITDANVVGGGGQATTAPGGQWQRLPLSSEGGSITALAIDPANPSVLYAGRDDGLFKSTDGARSWKRPPNVEGLVALVLIDPTAPSTLYAFGGTFGGQPDGLLHRSDDGGATWRKLTDPGLSIWPLVVWLDTTSNPSTIYALGYPSGRVRSTDRGETWTELSPEEAAQAESKRPKQLSGPTGTTTDFEGTVSPTDTESVLPVGTGRIDPSDPSVRYAGTEEGVYKSTDGGKSWKKASAGLTSSVVWRLVADPSSASILYAATPAGIFKTTDGGDTWDMILSGEGSVVVAPSSPSTLYAWTSAGLFRSDDAGGQWAELDGTGLPSRPYGQAPTMTGLLFVAADDPDILFADCDTSGTFRSSDSGNTWTQVVGNGGVFAADPEDPSTLYAITFSGGMSDSGQLARRISKSTDSGTTWAVISPTEWGGDIGAIAMDPHAPSNIYVAYPTNTGLNALSRSVDGGATWEDARLEGAGKYLEQLRFDPHTPGTLYVLTSQPAEGASESGVYRSNDMGNTWESIIAGLTDIAVGDLVISPAPRGAMYALTDDGLFKWVPRD
jgi:photosystem II stability/assembly factor-like uncharacterized protein